MNFLRRVFFVFISFSFFSLYSEPQGQIGMKETNVYDQYDQLIELFQSQKWKKLISHAHFLLKDFPKAAFAKEVHYYVGVAYFNIEEFELANDFFSKYLKEETLPKFFEEAMDYKFKIACFFQKGIRRHLFRIKSLPKWAHGYDKALEIFDEVIATLPRDERAAESLYRKGQLLLELGEYKESIEAYQTLIRRFPKHPLTPQAYLGVGEVYLIECQKEFLDNDRIELAEINLRKFQFHFPTEPRLAKVENMIQEMKEMMAKDLLEMGDFYKKTRKFQAAAIYYQTILKKYPNTETAQISKKELQKLGFLEDSFEGKE